MLGKLLNKAYDLIFPGSAQETKEFNEAKDAFVASSSDFVKRSTQTCEEASRVIRIAKDCNSEITMFMGEWIKVDDLQRFHDAMVEVIEQHKRFLETKSFK